MDNYEKLAMIRSIKSHLEDIQHWVRLGVADVIDFDEIIELAEKLKKAIEND